MTEVFTSGKQARRVLDTEATAVHLENFVNSYTKDVEAYFDGKTQAILQRYGPGPRVHYHVGLLDHPPPNLPARALRRRLAAAQEGMLFHAAKVWDASSTLGGEVLDVGCGLGGGSIFWAQEFGAMVTAVTCVRSHVDWVALFAAQAGVGSRVRPLLCDAAEIPGESRFDAAVAVDSSGYLPRKKWFQRLASLLRPKGYVFLIDCFLVKREYEAPFNRHWHTQIGTIPEYLATAEEAGLRTVSVEDISHRTEHFWTTTLALLKAETEESERDPAEAVRQEASLRAHALVRQGPQDNGLRYALMSFSKGG
jgi:tocopherol O-methyltransferase